MGSSCCHIEFFSVDFAVIYLIIFGVFSFPWGSNENLIRDTYLRQNMDEHGWVPVALIAKFRKVSCSLKAIVV